MTEMRMTTPFFQEPSACLGPTNIVDSEHPSVVAYANANGGGTSERERAISLYYAVRDEIRYDAYGIELSPDGLSASRALETRKGWCVSKSVLLAATCRSLNIPASLGYADVRNHLSTERMRKIMETDVFYWHGYTSIYIDGRWIKATPAFNIELCEKFRIRPLEFDGQEDSIYHPLDLDGQTHMEYLNYRGEFVDVPLSQMIEDFAFYYPAMNDSLESYSFNTEVEVEVSNTSSGD